MQCILGSSDSGSAPQNTPTSYEHTHRRPPHGRNPRVSGRRDGKHCARIFLHSPQTNHTHRELRARMRERPCDTIKRCHERTRKDGQAVQSGGGLWMHWNKLKVVYEICRPALGIRSARWRRWNRCGGKHRSGDSYPDTNRRRAAWSRRAPLPFPRQL
ncbi:hypothetical protein HYPSUDRAFT_156446 [Hypholoma sublateritium FD-334 SS-4]|uniref:Uncharacterized protein n=1 Tax=Hypholoma sublateritium (strain FD-334 SS-4) TaxID=945553 RepID=A0A0D2MVT1_HYPSF|nr:hypothetical protein HYPSUDRAFT_156446 [Hypholoma sublateritium FD-334 SS-4]